MQPAAEPEAAAARAFCDFLELRLLTRNLPLLRRMLDEHLGGGDERTVRDYLQLGATLIVVKPFDVRDRERRRRAAALLERQHQQTSALLERQRQQTAVLEPSLSPVAPAMAWRSVREREQRCCKWLLYLGARLQTRNLAWLRDMLAQFLLGREHRLEDFVRAGSFVVTFLPVKATVGEDALASSEAPGGGNRVTALLGDGRFAAAGSVNCHPRGDVTRRDDHPHTDKGSPNESYHLANRYECANKRGIQDSGADRPGFRSHEGSESGGDLSGSEDDDDDASAQGQPKRVRRHQQSDEEDVQGDMGNTNARDERLRQQEIQVHLDKVEAGEPWKFVFHGKLQLPFDEEKYPELTTALREFWSNHGRAVWERNFWAPLTSKFDSGRMEKRKRRQWFAVRSFELTVFEPAARLLGALFFVELDQRTAPAEGWWYRKKVVDLYTIRRQRKGAQAVREYLDTQAMKRFPRSAKRGSRYHYDGNGVSESMWSSSLSLESLVAEIRSLKQGTQDHHRRPPRRRSENSTAAKPSARENESAGISEGREQSEAGLHPAPDDDFAAQERGEEPMQVQSGHHSDESERTEAVRNGDGEDSGDDDEKGETREASGSPRADGGSGIVDLTVDGSDDADWHMDADGVIVMDKE
jgi:hypothetical protein